MWVSAMTNLKDKSFCIVHKIAYLLTTQIILFNTTGVSVMCPLTNHNPVVKESKNTVAIVL